MFQQQELPELQDALRLKDLEYCVYPMTDYVGSLVKFLCERIVFGKEEEAQAGGM